MNNPKVVVAIVVIALASIGAVGAYLMLAPQPYPNPQPQPSEVLFDDDFTCSWSYEFIRFFDLEEGDEVRIQFELDEDLQQLGVIVGYRFEHNDDFAVTPIPEHEIEGLSEDKTIVIPQTGKYFICIETYDYLGEYEIGSGHLRITKQ